MKIICVFGAGLSFASSIKNLLADHNATCDFAFDTSIHQQPSNFENARFYSFALVQNSNIVVNFMNEEMRSTVCAGAFDQMNEELSSRTGEVARAEIPDWFESKDLGNGQHQIRFCCEPRY